MIFSLWVDVTDCPSGSCACVVVNNQTVGSPKPVEFLVNRTNIGTVTFDNLQADTLYWFTLTCDGALEPITKQFRTYFGRPSPPMNVTARWINTRIQLVWLPPSNPAGPIHHYRIMLNGSDQIDNLPRDSLSYELREDDIRKITFLSVMACNIDQRNSTFCSQPEQVILPQPETTTARFNSATTISKLSYLYSIFCIVILFQ